MLHGTLVCEHFNCLCIKSFEIAFPKKAFQYCSHFILENKFQFHGGDFMDKEQGILVVDPRGIVCDGMNTLI